VNRELDGDFDPDEFEHLAFFNAKESQIEMHLVARSEVQVRLQALDLDLRIGPGERIHTEVSRKFTRESTDRLLREAGFKTHQWFLSDNGYFGLALALATDME
jgi:L-histidine N-alpha-methyltransferase